MIPVLLIRHGPTAWTVQGRIQGHRDVCLSEAGRVEVGRWRLPHEFREYDWVASPLARAVETAQLLGAVDLCADPRLAEMSWGQWEGYTQAEIRAANAVAAAENEADGLDFTPPGGESPRTVLVRLQDWLADVVRWGRPVIAVTHKGVIWAALAMATGWDMTGKSPHRLDWTSAHLFGIEGDGTLGLQRLNIALVNQ